MGVNKMMTMDKLAKAVERAVALAPPSARALALEAGIDPSLLTRILSGEKRATPEVSKLIEEALRRWEAQCRDAADIIEKGRAR
jgi:hypothetical protein